MIVATAGHIDHGKTLLVKALTGVDTDRLPEEKARGISIDLGFAYWPLAGGRLIGFVDVPGHERFIHNMLAGVCGIDFALLAVAADDGMMPQTVEHLQILDLLGIRRGVVAITKTDRVDPVRVAQVQTEVRALLATSSLAGISLLPVSALTGDGVEALRQTLVDAAAGHAARFHEGQHMRLAIDRVFSVVGSGTVVTGTVFNGEVRRGDRLVVSPRGVPVRVRGIQIRGEAVERARAGDRCALNLSGIDVGAVARGDWVLDKAIHAPSQRMDVRFMLLATERTTLAHWTPVHLHLATADVMARVVIRGGGVIAPGTSARVQFVIEAPITALNGDRFILRDRSGERTLGGGIVIDPLADGRRRASSAWLAALEQGTPEAALPDLLKISGRAVDCARFELTFNLSAARAASMYLSSNAVVLAWAPRVAIAQAAADAIRANILARLAEFHHAQAQAPGIEIAALRKELAQWLSAGQFSCLLRDLVEARMLEIHGSTVRLPGHDATSNADDENLWRLVLRALLLGRFVAPTITELACGLGLDEARLRDFLRRKSRSGEVMRVADNLFYPKATLAILAANAALVARSASKGMFSAAQYRDATGIGRTRTIKILEFFDSLGITQRIGDARKMYKNFVPILGAAKPALATAPGAKKDMRGGRKS